jgi:2-oxoacid dehydrogenases acyltransferase (catalytic domain)
MFSGERPDGALVRKAPKVRLFMPYLLPRRGDAVVFYEQKIDISQTLDYLERWNDGGTRVPLRFFHIYLAAIARMMHERPRANRFIAGRRLYQRHDVAISISVLKARDDDAKLTVVKQIYPAGLGLTGAFECTEAVIGNGRAAAKTPSEREVTLIQKLLPRWLIPVLPRLQKLGDWLNITPASLSANDPLYASIMVSNLGSIGIDSAYHHLYEHGTLPIFAVIGAARQEAVVTKRREVEIRPVVTVRYTLDERIVDGYYAARSLDMIQSWIEQPWLMETAQDNGPGAL